jgi:hypothetical protein
VVKVGVGAPDERFEALAGLCLGESEADRVSAVACRESVVALEETGTGFRSDDVWHRADERVAAVAQDHVVGAEVRAQRVNYEAQQRVACTEALRVVELLEAVDVDERECQL